MSIRAKGIFKIVIVFAVLISFGLYFFSKTNAVKAAISSCSASITPSDPQANVQITFNLTVTNNDSANNVMYFKVTRPHSGLTFVSNAMYPAWYVDWATESLTYRAASTPLVPGQSISPEITMNIGDIAGATGNWVVQATDDTQGANLINCEGSLSLTVTGGTDQTPPIISDLAVSGIGSSQATVSWNTDEASNSRVEYGLESEIYSLNKTDSLYTVNHSLTLTSGVASATTYYYRACSADETGNESCSSESSFTTAAVGATTAPTATRTPTSAVTTGTPTATPTPTPYVDRTPPRVTITTEFEKSYEQAPKIEGGATDNEAVTSIDYSTDGGENWLPVDEISDPETDSTDFYFIPYIFDDGNYEIKVRAIDAEANTGTSDTLILVIDRLPPRVGGNLISLGPQPLLPNEDGVIVTMAGLDMKVTLSAVGGPTQVSLFVDDEEFKLQHSDETGLWSGYINLSEKGLYQLKSQAEDGAGNITSRLLNPILVVDPGEIEDENGKAITSGEISLYTQDPLSKIWALWDGKTFYQDNPQKLKEGNYQYFLPPGNYYLEIKSSGYQTLTSQIFYLQSSTPFNASFVMKKSQGLHLGIFKLSFFQIFSQKASIKLTLPRYSKENLSESLVGEEAEDFTLATIKEESFELNDLRGEESVLSFINTWSPPAVEQVLILDKLVTDKTFPIQIISNQETASKIKIFSKRGKYESDIVVDADGELVENYNINSLPMHFFLDRKGIIRKIITGVLSKEEFNAIIDQI
ncbi:hypothetical protein A2Z22_05225 [Candidatus Woesebacteria bacterium RBG_16_34_12]|uniref:Uncharacterized protein n=1 Tax=Candidatus Woesebacteria bacterium RBG_16_34_12 TaxID=1802480 RepID=A0A1F7XAZ9_9BACT|nr:MAG: hypothetical protein A2Z22_05225 [Candidatus Woesebacteria bacterium RBG_16_34_12]